MLVEAPKEEDLLLRALVCLRGVHRNPAPLPHVELGPAVVARDPARRPVLRQRHSHHEARRNPERPRLGDEERVEVGAVPHSNVTRVESITPSPALSARVVLERDDNVVVQPLRLRERVLEVAGDLLRLPRDPPADRYQRIRGEEASHLGRRKRSALLRRLGEIARPAPHPEGHTGAHSPVLTTRRPGEVQAQKPIAVLRLGHDHPRRVPGHPKPLEALQAVGWGNGNPGPHPLHPGWDVRHQQAVAQVNRPLGCRSFVPDERPSHCDRQHYGDCTDSEHDGSSPLGDH